MKLDWQRWPRRLIQLAIQAYQAGIAPVLGPACRYEPSCSHFASEAVEKHGALRGSWLAVQRISRCHPWAGSGYDPVP
jgi:putative membrane protein insertion efficiency factor